MGSDLTQSAPRIIEEAARSTLGILALMILALSVLGFFFFRRSSERTRTVVYLLLFVGVASFSVATVRSASSPAPPSETDTTPRSDSRHGRRPAGQPSDGNRPMSVETHNAVAGPLSTDRDAPTPLRSNEIRGSMDCEGKRGQQYARFRGGPGEIKATLEAAPGNKAAIARLTLLGEDFDKIARLSFVAPRNGSERKVVRVQFGRQRTVIAELDLDCVSGGTFLLRVEGSVQLE